MPDPLKQTVSASQVGALFGVSPYASPWSLYHWFKGTEIETENNRMAFGKFVQPFILAETAKRLRLHITENIGEVYQRGIDAQPIGCTPDGVVHDPVRGLGAIEAKNVDYRIWKDQWSETAAPKYIELQLQTTLAAIGASWGAISCMIGQNDRILIYEREALPKVAQQIRDTAARFLTDVAEGREPAPTGTEYEDEILQHLYPETVAGQEITTEDPTIGEAARMYRWAKERADFYAAVAKSRRVDLLNCAQGAEWIFAPGATVHFRRSPTRVRIKVNHQEEPETQPEQEPGLAP